MATRKRKFQPALSRTDGKATLTNLSKEPYITFSVRTTSPTTVCRYSRGTLEGNGKSQAYQIFGLTASSHREKHFYGSAFFFLLVGVLQESIHYFQA